MISIIAAIGENRELGKDNKLLWYIPEDFRHFKQITASHAVIMGRRTYESIGRPLSNRLNIVITRNKDRSMSVLSPPHPLRGAQAIAQNKHLRSQNIVVVNSLEQAIEVASSLRGPRTRSGGRGNPNEIALHTLAMTEDEIFVIGGGQIYEQAIKIADKLYLTIVEGTYKADTYFPDYSDFKKVISQEKHESSGYKYTFLELIR